MTESIEKQKRRFCGTYLAELRSAIHEDNFSESYRR